MSSGKNLMIIIKFLGDLNEFNKTLDSVAKYSDNIFCLGNTEEIKLPQVASIAEAQKICQDDFFMFLCEGDTLKKVVTVYLKDNISHYQALFVHNNFSNFFPLYFNNKIQWDDNLNPIDSNLKIKTLYFEEMVINSNRKIEDVYTKKLEEGLAESDLNKSISLFLEAWTIQNRAEPLYYIAKKYREKKQYALGYMFAKKAVEEKIKIDFSNVERDIYQWKALDELSVCSYWVKNYKESYLLAKKVFKLAPENERERIAANIKYSKKYINKKTRIKFKENINKALSKTIAKYSLFASNIVEVNQSNNGITGIIRHYSSDGTHHICINNNKKEAKKIFNNLKQKNLTQPKHKLFNELALIDCDIDFLIINETEKNSDIALGFLWNKLKSNGKVLISNKSYLRYISGIKKAYPNFKKSGYALVVKS